ncbi:YitT family protein [Psychrobacillus sp. BL-248-WT-3]|uniref:YitT family protein n=1 Tax=Psychrobacillus sp. BL-248-WT-3 TaxID=2725306 RepID=UPI00146C9BB4|nr:YitT family protein [Psychrobacillus sp. BL-248-WT-3]NME07315.1 YitT family protein [Psychrobacillus sp. BL-248-WT-3]
MYLFKKGLVIIFGSIFIALGINMFLVPYEILDGGVIGIGLILNYLWGFKTGATIIFFSIPIFVIAWFKYREYFYNSLHGMIISSFFIDLLKPFSTIVVFDSVPSAIVGGSMVGIGIGFMLRYRTSTGGTDLIAQFISAKTGVNVGINIFVIDSLVLVVGGLLLSMDSFLLSIMTILSVAMTTSLIARKTMSKPISKESVVH